MMAKVKAEHVVMRNGNPFCSHCGSSYVLNLPASINMVAAICDVFVKEHARCKKTWIEPTIESGKSEQECARFWFECGEHGISSETMYSVLSGHEMLPPSKFRPPSDPDDFRRCHLLLETVPQWRSQLKRLEHLSPVWAALVENWDKLTDMLLEQMQTKKANGMYQLMKQLGT